LAKTALILGASGQDGGYLISLLRSMDYIVHAQSRRPAPRADGAVVWHSGELTDASFLAALLGAAAFDEVYNLAAVSRPALSWEIPLETTLLNALVPQQLCELLVKSNASSRLFQASSSEMFGATPQPTQDETTVCMPESPYGISKYFAHRMVGVYRSRYGLHASCGILFNHESPSRPLTFVTQKIAHAAAAISRGINTTAELDERGEPIVNNGRLKLGNIEARRDFGFAGDVVAAMHMIVRNDTPDDYIIGTGESRSIGEFCAAAFGYVGLNWQDYVATDQALLRPTDLKSTRADASKLARTFGWKPKVSFDELVAMMVESRLAALAAAG